MIAATAGLSGFLAFWLASWNLGCCSGRELMLNLIRATEITALNSDIVVVSGKW